jgi:ceramide glucosyltransferase
VIEPLAMSGLWFVVALMFSLVDADFANARFAVVGLLSKTTLDAAVFGLVRGEHAPLLAWPLSLLRDCLMLSAWLRACVSRTVEWRGNRLRIGRGTQLTPLTTWDAASLPAEQSATYSVRL